MQESDQSRLFAECFADVTTFHQAMLSACVAYMPVRGSSCGSGLQLCFAAYQAMVFGWAHADPDVKMRVPGWELEPYRDAGPCFLDPLMAAILVTAVNTSCASLDCLCLFRGVAGSAPWFGSVRHAFPPVGL